MPTGLKNSPAPLPGVALAESQPRSSTNVRFQIIFVTTGRAVQIPRYLVSPGMEVSLRGVNGAAVNAHDAFATDHMDKIGTSDVQTVSPDTEIAYPVDDTGEIWMAGTAGDGLLVTVRGSSVG